MKWVLAPVVRSVLWLLVTPGLQQWLLAVLEVPPLSSALPVHHSLALEARLSVLLLRVSPLALAVPDSQSVMHQSSEWALSDHSHHAVSVSSRSSVVWSLSRLPLHDRAEEDGRVGREEQQLERLGHLMSDEPLLVCSLLRASVLPVAMAQPHSWLGSLLPLAEDVVYRRLRFVPRLLFLQPYRLRPITDQL